jgi:hypothetical protein
MSCSVWAKRSSRVLIDFENRPIWVSPPLVC